MDLRNVWRDKKADLRPEFVNKKNLALRGLYWLALDVIGDDPIDQDSAAPEAAELKRIRNLLEHRSLILRETGTASPMGAVETISLADFERHTFHVLKLARAALMYLAFSMRIEEDMRQALNNSPGRTHPTAAFVTFSRGELNLRTPARRLEFDHLAPHDLRRTCAKLRHVNGGELEQIQFLLGHASS